MGLFSWIRAHSERKAARAAGTRRHHYRRRYRTTRRSVRSDDTEYFSADEQDVSGASPRPPDIAEDQPFDAFHSAQYLSDDNGVVTDGDKVIVQPDRRGSGCLPPLGPTRSGKRLVLAERPSAGNSFGRRSVQGCCLNVCSVVHVLVWDAFSQGRVILPLYAHRLQRTFQRPPTALSSQRQRPSWFGASTT